MSLYKRTKELLDNNDLAPRKRFGQNFLVDVHALDAITEAAEISPEDTVLEIGAGTGTLTHELARLSGRVIAVELDKGLFRILESVFQDNDKITLINSDILDLDFSSVMGAESRIKVLGNLPYYITTPILMKILDESARLPIQMALLMVQEEVGVRIAASPGGKDYGSLSIALAYRSEVEILRRVPASSFYPKPKVGSVLVKFSMRADPPVKVEDEILFFQIVRTAFHYRRKTLRNALLLGSRSGETQLPADSLDSAFQHLGMEPTRRGETLSMEEFAALANAICRLRAASQ